jgi:predicted nucleic acid-binding protein
MTTSEPDLALVDTNLLVYALLTDGPHYAPSRALLDQAQAGSLSLCVTPQVLAEFYAIVTNARRVTDPRPPQEVFIACRSSICINAAD